MNKEQKNRFRIGEVAQMYHISMGTLVIMKKEGLMQPECIDPENGYRYYGVCQLEVLNTIRYLRTLDMPLEEIREFIQNRDIPVIEEKLKKQKELIEHKRRELEQIERKIDHRLRQIEDAKQAAVEIDRAVFEVTPAIRIARIRRPMENGALESYLGLEVPIQRLSKGQEKPLVFMGKVGVGIEKEHLMQGKLDCYDFVFLAFIRKTCTAEPWKKCRKRYAPASASGEATGKLPRPAGVFWRKSTCRAFSGERMVQRDCPGG